MEWYLRLGTKDRLFRIFPYNAVFQNQLCNLLGTKAFFALQYKYFLEEELSIISRINFDLFLVYYLALFMHCNFNLIRCTFNYYLVQKNQQLFKDYYQSHYIYFFLREIECRNATRKLKADSKRIKSEFFLMTNKL